MSVLPNTPTKFGWSSISWCTRVGPVKSPVCTTQSASASASCTTGCNSLLSRTWVSEKWRSFMGAWLMGIDSVRYCVGPGGSSCSIRSLFHSPSATRTALASYRNASIRLWET